MHLSRKSSGPELEESTMKNARIGFRTEEFWGEHPAGACCLGSNGETTTTAQTKPVRQFDCRTDYRTVWPTPGTRLTYWVEFRRQNNKRSFWMNRRDSSRSSSSSEVFSSFLVCIFDLNLILWGIFKDKNGFRYNCSENCVCRIMFRNNHEYE